MKKYDVVVIGAGPGGYVAAIRLSQYGKKVAIIEKGNVGGVCLNVGCIPSKGLIHTSQLYNSLENMAQFGIEVSGVKLNVKKLQEWKQGVVQKLTGGIAALLKANNVELIQGEAVLSGKTQLVVTQGKEATKLAFDSCIIATGSRPMEIPNFSFDEELILSSTEALSLKTIPKKFVVIGGGYIGLEIGSFYAAFGSEVTVVEAMSQILPGNDRDLAQPVAKELKKRDVRILTQTKALGWKKEKGSLALEVEGKKGKENILADKILLSVGRRPNVENIGLDNVGVKTDNGFIKVDSQLKTSVDNIFAIGDVVGQPMLAHKASKEGLVAADVIVGKRACYDVRAMPAVVFTTPEVATVGLSETQAKEKGLDFKIGKFPFAASGKAMATTHTDGFVKVIADSQSDIILGVGIVGHEASNLIGEAALAIEMGARAEDLALTVHPHPTLSEGLMEACEALHKKAIHIINK